MGGEGKTKHKISMCGEHKKREKIDAAVLYCKRAAHGGHSTVQCARGWWVGLVGLVGGFGWWVWLGGTGGGTGGGVHDSR